MSENQQNSTEETGLTIIQIKSIELLVSGRTKTEIAKELGIDRTTLYHWGKSLNYITYLNRVTNALKCYIEHALNNQAMAALETISLLLEQGQESTKMKIAIWLLENRDKNQRADDLRAEIIKRSSKYEGDWDIPQKLDEALYTRLCKENGISAIVE